MRLLSYGEDFKLLLDYDDLKEEMFVKPVESPEIVPAL